MAVAPMLHEEDPATKIARELGDLSGINVFHNQVLVAVYQRPQKTKSGILLAPSTLDEDRYQSKIGLIVKMGDKAFVPAGDWSWRVAPKIDSWIVFRPSDGWSVTINGVLCRMLVDTSVKGAVAHPDLIW